MKGLVAMVVVLSLVGCAAEPQPAAQPPAQTPAPAKSGEGPAPTRSGGEIQVNPNAGKIDQPGSAIK